MEPVPRTLPENFRVIYEWLRRLDRRTQRVSRPPALMPGARLGPHAGTISDLDNATATGYYAGDSRVTANVPTSDFVYWFVEVTQDEGGRIVQTAHPHDVWRARYVRKGSPGGTWGEWMPMQRERVRSTLLNASFRGSGIALGNGTAYRDEWIADGVVHQALTINVGSTTQVTGEIEVYCGWGTIAGGLILMAGNGRYIRSGRIFDMAVTVSGNVAIIRLRKDDSGGGWVEHVPAGSIASWTSGSVLSAQWSFPIS